jgi:hypothetical protein
MARKRAHSPKGPAVGTVLTGMIVGQAKKGVLVELGAIELLLPRSRYGAAADRIEEAGYGEALTVEVVAGPDGSGPGLTRVAIERSFRQPRSIDGVLRRQGSGFLLAPDDGGDAIAVLVLDRLDSDALVGTSTTWSVGAPYRGVRLVAPAS